MLFLRADNQPASHPCRYDIAGDTTIEMDTGRLLALNFDYWITGQYFRIRCLDNALTYIMGHKEVWTATEGRIFRWYKKST